MILDDETVPSIVFASPVVSSIWFAPHLFQFAAFSQWPIGFIAFGQATRLRSALHPSHDLLHESAHRPLPESSA